MAKEVQSSKAVWRTNTVYPYDYSKHMKQSLKESGRYSMAKEVQSSKAVWRTNTVHLYDYRKSMK